MPLRIGIDARKLPDFGIGTYIRGLLRGLADLDRENAYLLLADERARALVPPLPANFQWVDERAPVHSLAEQVALSWRLRRLRLDLFHAPHWALPGRVPCRVVVTLHDLIQLLFPATLRSGTIGRIYARLMIRRAVRRGDRIIAVSEATRRDLIERLGADPQRIERVPNGVDEEFRRALPPPDLAERRRRLGLPDEYLLFLGNPKPHKNLERLVKAYARALARRPAIPHLVCAGGDGAAWRATAGRAAGLGLGERVRFLGHLDQRDLPALYQGATLFLYPSLYEGFGLPVVEAMASGTPVLTSRTSALGEIAAGAAELVDPLDVEAIAAGIERCLGDPAHRAELVAAGHRRAAGLSWRRTARRTLEVYGRALGRAIASDEPVGNGGPA